MTHKEKELIEQARMVAAEREGIAITDQAGLLGPMVFSKGGRCGHIIGGVGVDYTVALDGSRRRVLCGGLITNDEARRLRDWLTTHLDSVAATEGEKP